MSDEFDDEFEDESGQQPSSDLVKDLRRQLKAQKKANDEALTQLKSFQAEQRKTNVARLLEASGANPKYAKFYTSEDASEEAVKAWIQSESELLGVTAPEPEPANADQVRGISQAVANAPQARPQSTPSAVGPGQEAVAALNAAKSPEEFWQALQAAGLRTS